MELEQLAEYTNEFVSVRDERLAADKYAAELKTRENLLKDFIIEELYKNGMSMCAGKTRMVTLQTKEKPVPEDWDKIYTWMEENNNHMILQRRLHEGHIKELGENGVEVPGIAHYEVNSLSVRKL